MFYKILDKLKYFSVYVDDPLFSKQEVLNFNFKIVRTNMVEPSTHKTQESPIILSEVELQAYKDKLGEDLFT